MLLTAPSKETWVSQSLLLPILLEIDFPQKDVRCFVLGWNGKLLPKITRKCLLKRKKNSAATHLLCSDVVVIVAVGGF